MRYVLHSATVTLTLARTVARAIRLDTWPVTTTTRKHGRGLQYLVTATPDQWVQIRAAAKRIGDNADPGFSRDTRALCRRFATPQS